MKPAPPQPPRRPLRRRLGRVGLAGFAFFLVKGLLWLVVPALLVALGVRC